MGFIFLSVSLPPLDHVLNIAHSMAKSRIFTMFFIFISVDTVIRVVYNGVDKIANSVNEEGKFMEWKEEVLDLEDLDVKQDELKRKGAEIRKWVHSLCNANSFTLAFIARDIGFNVGTFYNYMNGFSGYMQLKNMILLTDYIRMYMDVTKEDEGEVVRFRSKKKVRKVTVKA